MFVNRKAGRAAGAVAVIICMSLAGAQQAMARQGFAAIAVDARSGKILYAKNADARRIPASITKVMTAYLLFSEIRKGRFSLSSRLRISRHAASMQPSKLGLRPGSTISVDEAIRAIVTKSANDIAVAIAENVAGSESRFAYRMTVTARAMGMTRTTFRNASGLPKPPNVTTARDLATLALRIQRDFPRLYRRYFALRHFRYRGRVYRNHNRLLGRVRGMDGLKTGYTRAAGFNLAASTRRGGKRLVTVVLGARSGRSRNAYMARLIEDMFRHKHLTSGTMIAAVAGNPPGWNAAARRNFAAARKRLARQMAALRPQPRPKALEVARTRARKGGATIASRAKATATAPMKPPAPAGAKNAARRARATVHTAKNGATAKETVIAKAQAAERAGAASGNAVPGVVFARVRPQPRPDAAATTAAEANNETVIAKAAPPLRGPLAGQVMVRVRPEAAQKGAGAAASQQRQDTATGAGQQGPENADARLRSWNIQLGSFPAPEGAKKRLGEARKRFRPYVRGKEGFTMVFRKGGTTYYRARFTGFDRRSALRACRAMRRKGISCLALAPRNS